MSDRFFRYIAYSNVEKWLRLGWFVSADLGPPHSAYSVLMERVCCCGRMPY